VTNASIMGGLPRRDLWLLPLISVLTVFTLVVGVEIASRIIWPQQLLNTCRLSDPQLGVRYRPNCSTIMKTSEGPWYVSAYNSCGYRSDAPCGPLPDGRRRIALLGTSLSEGYLVPYRDTIAARLETDLTRSCGIPVEVQNLGTLANFGDQLLFRMDEALKLQPNAVVLVLAPFDLQEDLVRPPVAAPPEPSPQKHLFQIVKGSRALEMARHFLFRNPSVYLPLSLRYGDRADFLRPPFTDKWQERLQVLDRIVDGLTMRARQAGIPLVIAFIPEEAQVALMAPGRTVPPGVDPEALPAAVGAIASRHGAAFIDTSLRLRTDPAPEQFYYAVDGHLSGDGQPAVGAYIAQRLAADAGQPFADCKSANTPGLKASR
jgi:hypothetical protein